MTPKEHKQKKRLNLQQQAKTWREVADSLYARALYSKIVGPMADSTLEEIAEELNLLRIPKVRGAGRWTASDVTRLMARVASMADDARHPAAWTEKMDGIMRDLAGN